MPNYFTALSSLGSMSVALQATANNIANVNTNGYKAQRVILTTGPHDQDVHVAQVLRDMSPGPAIINSIGEVESRSANESVARGHEQRAAMDSAATTTYNAELSRADSSAGLVEQEVRAYDSTVASASRRYIEGSNTDLPREFANLNVTSYAYSAVASTVRANDELVGTLLNIVA